MSEADLWAEIRSLKNQLDRMKTQQDAGSWKSWTPTYSASGSMTFTSVTTNEASYMINKNKLSLIISAVGTIGGTPSNEIYFTLPKTLSSLFVSFSGLMVDAGTIAAYGFPLNSTTCRVRRYDGATLALGSKTFYLFGHAKI